MEDAALARRLKFWKAVGDELIFTVDVLHEQDVYKVVTAWVAAMRQYELELQDKNQEENSFKNKMKTKGGAFIATFPDPDYCVAVPTEPVEADSERDVLVRNEEMKRESGGSHLFDYLGPSIDTGFRIVGQCSQRFFTLSLEVAWAMAYDRLHNQFDKEISGLTLLSETPLKGVWDGRSYPIFALDREYDDAIARHISSVQGKGVIQLLDVQHLAEACILDGAWPSTVYFPDSSHDIFKKLKQHLDSQQKILDEKFDQSGESLEEFAVPDAESDLSNGLDAASMEIHASS